jgi:hypothetical protein
MFELLISCYCYGSEMNKADRVGSVDIETRLRAGLLCSIPGRSKRILSSYCPDRLWGSPKLSHFSPESICGATHPLRHTSSRLAA